MAYKPYVKNTSSSIADLPIQAEISNKLGTTDVGNSVNPVYLKNGAPMPCSENLKSVSEIVNLIYPVGAYFITESSNFNTVAKVQAHFGGTWTQLDAGRFLETVTSGAGTNKDAGLPNIKAKIGTDKGPSGKTPYGFLHRSPNQNINDVYASGAFEKDNNSGDNGTFGSGNVGAVYVGITLDASKYNAIYKDSISTVQPKSRTVYIYRRTA